MLKRITLFLGTVAMAAFCCSAQVIASPTFSLSILSSTSSNSEDAGTEFRIGSEIWLLITMTNTTNHIIDCSGEWKSWIDTAYTYRVTEEDGKPVEEIVPLHKELVPSKPIFSDIAAGENCVRPIKISAAYKFDHPGKYVLQASRFDPEVKDKDGNEIEVKSNPITITITE